MKLPLASGVLSGAVSGDGASSGRFPIAEDRRFERELRTWILRIDRTFDPKMHRFSLGSPRPETYRPGAPSDRWDVVLDGGFVVLTEIQPFGSTVCRFVGWEEAPAGDLSERAFAVSDAAGRQGRFILRADDSAELTIFNPEPPMAVSSPRTPVLTSERGRLVPRLD